MKEKIFTGLKFLLIYVALPLAVVILPLLLTEADWPIIGNTYGKRYEPFELFGFFAALALIAGGIFKIRSQRDKSLKRLTPIFLFLVVGFYFLTLITEYSHKLGDYMCYEAAARALLAGKNPYSGTNYIYPPLTAEVLAALYKGALFGSKILGIQREQQNHWESVFYFYQCLQYFLVIISYLLCVRFARNLRLKPEAASALVAVLFVLNNPLIRTIHHNQTNLWVLCAILAFFLFLPRYPSASGFSLAFGIHFKLYPSLLLPYWAASKKFKAVIWSLLWFFVILAVETKFFRDFFVWKNFLDFFKSFPKGIYFRDNSIHSLFFNLFNFANGLFKIKTSPEKLSASVHVVVWIINLSLLAWFLLRLLKRRKFLKNLDEPSLTKEEKIWVSNQVLYGCFFDAVALMLLLSPRVWEHHYILTVPMLIYAISVRGVQKPWIIGTSAFLILGLPTFDIFPLSYHRLAGLLLLVFSVRPQIYSKECESDLGLEDEKSQL